ncbi:hypothetical protein HMPREF1155_1133 [Slackia sp. CM382]|nr:hypothetical protein HMPREF1155_1133 [Slackia sp. CM382]
MNRPMPPTCLPASHLHGNGGFTPKAPAISDVRGCKPTRSSTYAGFENRS